VDNLLCVRRRKFLLGTTDSRHGLPIYPNVAADMVLTSIDSALGRRYHLHPLATGTLSASSADVTVSTAGYQGTGYTLSGITFPVTVAAGQSAKFTVTFTPQIAGSSPGSVSFLSNASDSSLMQTFSCNGQQTTQHSVALSWTASTSSVVGYNVYRGTPTGGPYSAKLTAAPVASTNYTDSSVASGTTYFYVTTAVDSSNTESGYSNEATAAVP
jgi:hypothetical protein